jgi:hypothetical protein
VTLYYTALGLLFGARAFFADRRGRTDLLYWSVLLALFLFSGFRWQVGCDWPAYTVHFEDLPSRPVAEILASREPGYWLLVELLRRIGLPFYSLNVATSAVFFAGLHLLARRQTDPLGFLVLAFPVLIINMPMSGIRQGAAIGLVCIALVAFIDRKPLRFVGWVLAASLFHASAVVFLPLVTFVFGGVTQRSVLGGTLLALPGFYFVATSDAAEVAVTRYVATGIESHGGQFRIGLLALTALAYFALAHRTWARRFPADHALVALGAALMILLGLLLPVSTTIADRLGYYLVPIQLMIFARLPFLFGGQSRTAVAFAPYLGLGLVFVVWSQFRHFQECYLPYGSVFAQ